MGFATTVTGDVVAVRRIGANEIETRMEAPMNKAAVPASPSVSKPCAPIMPKGLGNHIGREYLATGFIGGGIVEPAFSGYIHARHAEADQNA